MADMNRALLFIVILLTNFRNPSRVISHTPGLPPEKLSTCVG
jgi:hypothetical protein